MPPKKGPEGPSAAEHLRLKAELDRTRRELSKWKKAASGAGPQESVAPGSPAASAPGAGAAAPASMPPSAEASRSASTADGPGTDELRRQIAELTAAKGRLSKLYFRQLEENRARARKLHHVLENIGRINSDLDLDALLERLVATIHDTLGFRVVLLRIREPGTDILRARAFMGISEDARSRFQNEDLPVATFLSWLREEFQVSRSFFISHRHDFNRSLPPGYRPALGTRQEWEWHEDDVLFVPLYNRAGELVAYFSVDDPGDRLVPSTETVELLEIFGNHAVVAIENARLYGELERQTRELHLAGRRMQEMHALKSNFVSTVSHELRTPLTAIRAYLDTLLHAPDGDLPADQVRRFLSIINDESQRLARLIESVLDLNRFDSGEIRVERRVLDLGEVVEETVRLLEPVAQAGEITLKMQNEIADTRVEADRDQMRQLVLHLGSNAVKFTPAGGSVTIRLLGDGEHVRLDVEDTGIGIPERELGKVFERFYQVDSSLVRRYGGTGLGLAICKSIVEWHGGRVAVESAPDRGSCFTVTLPRRGVAREIPAPAAESGRRHAPEDLLKLAVEMVAGVMNARVVSLLAPAPGGDLVMRAAVGLDERVIREARVRPGQGVAGWVALHRRPVCVSNPGPAAEVAGSGRTQYRTGTFLSVPLENEDGLVGVLNVTDPASQAPFDVEDCHLLLHLAERVTDTFDRVREVESRAQGLENAAAALHQVLAHLGQGRRQADRRGSLARAIARDLGLSESDIGAIRFAASIHDVGMQQAAAHFADRPGVLTEDERRAMQRHAELGAELLEPIETVGVVREIVRSHHEWWDGTGYPRGLRGEEIPLGARILAIVDAWESIVEGRAWRAARSPEEARLEIVRLSGRQFDPRVVETFERVVAGTEAPAAPLDATADARR